MLDTTSSTTYTASIIEGLENEAKATNLTISAYREEWQRLIKECSDLVEIGYVHSSDEIQDNMKNRHSVTHRIAELEAESTAYLLAICKLKED